MSRCSIIRKRGLDYTPQENAYLAKLLDALADERTAGNATAAYELREEIEAAAVCVGHGAMGKTLNVMLHTRENGSRYATVGSIWRGD